MGVGGLLSSETSKPVRVCELQEKDMSKRDGHQKRRARKKRRKATLSVRQGQLNRRNWPSERWFDAALKAHNIGGYHRNYPLLQTYFGDFVWLEHNLVIEIDGSSHKGRAAYDQQRDLRLWRAGYRVLRVDYKDQTALEKMIMHLKELGLVGTPSLLVAGTGKKAVRKAVKTGELNTRRRKWVPRIERVKFKKESRRRSRERPLGAMAKSKAVFREFRKKRESRR